MENRPHINATVKMKWDEFTFSDRNRLEFRIREGAEDGLRYRNKFTATLPVLPTGWQDMKLIPYLADEIFLDFIEDTFSENRVYAGFNVKSMKYLGVEAYYMWDLKRSSNHWVGYHVIGTKVKLQF